jgi:DNA-binding XRE family transcriptional regulator
MPQDNPDSDELKLRAKRAREWKMFRRNNMLTQVRLADMIGVSRRTIQKVENRYLTPHQQTIRRFAAFKSKYDSNAGRDLSGTTFDDNPKTRSKAKWHPIPTT